MAAALRRVCGDLGNRHGYRDSRAEHQAVFDKFYKVAQLPRSAGTGLGLAIAASGGRDGGKIWVEASREGSRFSFSVQHRWSGQR